MEHVARLEIDRWAKRLFNWISKVQTEIEIDHQQLMTNDDVKRVRSNWQLQAQYQPGTVNYDLRWQKKDDDDAISAIVGT